MQVYRISLLVLILSFIISCKNNKESQSSTESASTAEELIEQGYELVSPGNVNSADIAKYVASAKSILEHRIENDENESWAIIEHGVWEYEFIYQNAAMSEPGEYAGHWIDFDDKNGFEYGIKNEIKGKGMYHYSPDTDLLLLVDDNNGIKPREYKVKIAGDVMIFSGSAEYKDNGMQGKLKKVMERPS